MTAPVIRNLALSEVETLVSWAGDEGWNPGLADAAAFHAADPDGFLGVFVDGEMAGGISAVAYGTTFGFIGLYIVKPEYRGRGLGRAVWDAGIKRLEGRTIGLDGVPEQQANYRSMGFLPAYESVRLTGQPWLKHASFNVSDEADPDSVSGLDATCFPADRRSLLQAWLSPLHIIRAISDDTGLRGYGVVRRCLQDYKIGPLFADSAEIAMAILAALVEAVEGPVQIDAPLLHPDFTGALLSAGMTPGFSTTRMYRGPAPDIEMAKVFGVTTLELG